MSKLSIAMFALLTGLGIHAIAIAQSAAPASASQTSQTSTKSGANDRQPVKPGDRNCLQQTGSLIHSRKGRNGECLPLAGHSYSGDELKRTGATNTARALQMLDPSIRIGH